MIRPEYLRRLVDAAHVELYLSGQDGARIYWPWRMEKEPEASQSYRDACEVYVVGSDPENEDVTTRDVLDTAHSVGAEVASLADVYQDCSATADAILDGLALADDHPFDGDLLLPLQKPFVECYQEVGEPSGHWLGIGGLKDASDMARIEAASALREYVGPDERIHGLGWGATDGIVRAVHEDPALLDSLDYSTPLRSAPRDIKTGAEHKSVVAAYAGARLVRDLRLLSTHPDEQHDQLTTTTLMDHQ